ncbi:MAG: DUF1844 domain-containing protein [Pirellulaceae bacterium]
MTENEQDVPADEPQVDEDWKSQVQAEKEAGTDDEPQADEPAADEPTADEPTADEPAADEPAADEPAADEPAADELAAEGVPEASFSTLISVLATQAMVALGEGIPGQQEQTPVQLSLARYHVDTLSVLQEKTAGNLSDEETALLKQVLYQLRMMYVTVQKQGDAAQD